MDVIEKIKRGFLQASLGKVFLSVSNLVINALLARLLGPDSLGEYFLIVSVLMLLSTMAIGGLKVFVVKVIASLEKDEGVQSCVGYISLSLGYFLVVVLALLFYLFFGEFLFGFMYKKPGLVDLILALSGVLILRSVNSVLVELFRGLKLIGHAVMFNGVFQNALLIIMLVLGYYEVQSLSDVLGFLLISSLISHIVILYFFLTKLKKLTDLNGQKLYESYLRIKPDVTLTLLPAWWHRILVMFINEASILIGGLILVSSSIAILGVAIKLSALLAMPLMLLNSVLSPYISSLYAEDKIDKLNGILQRSSLFATMMAGVIFVFVYFFGEAIIIYLFGAEYAEAYILFLILVFGQLINVVSGSCVVALNMTGESYLAFKINLFVGLFGVLLMFVLGGIYEVEGVAIASVMIMSIQMVLSAGYLYKRKRLKTWVGY